MELTKTIEEAWGWGGIRPAQVVAENDFGNLIAKDLDGRYWRICPEDLYCKVIANSREELDALSQNQEFLKDWYMTNLVATAREKFGTLPPGRKYCLKIPGILGGEYGGSNLGTMPLVELLAVSGHIAHEIKDVPDGAQVRLQVTT